MFLDDRLRFASRLGPSVCKVFDHDVIEICRAHICWPSAMGDREGADGLCDEIRRR